MTAYIEEFVCATCGRTIMGDDTPVMCAECGATVCPGCAALDRERQEYVCEDCVPSDQVGEPEAEDADPLLYGVWKEQNE